MHASSALRCVRDGQDDGLHHGAAPRARRPLTAPTPRGGCACTPIEAVAELEARDGLDRLPWRAMARAASRVCPRWPGRRQGGRPRWPGPAGPRPQVVETSALSPSESDVRGRGTPGVPVTAGGRRRPRRRPWGAVSATAAGPGSGAVAGMSPGAWMPAARRMTPGAQPSTQDTSTPNDTSRILLSSNRSGDTAPPN